MASILARGTASLPLRVLEEDSASSSNPTDAVLFVGISLVLGIACRHALRGTRVPYTVALLVIGIGLGALGLFSECVGVFYFIFFLFSAATSLLFIELCIRFLSVVYLLWLLFACLCCYANGNWHPILFIFFDVYFFSSVSHR